MTSLMELEQDRDSLVERIMQMIESDDPTDTLQALDELERQISTKADSIAAVHASQKGQIDYLKSRIKHYENLLKIRENALDRFEKYIRDILERKDVPVINGKVSKLTLVKNGGKPPLWINENIPIESYPSELLTAKTTLTLNKEAVRDSLDQSGSLWIKDDLAAQEQPRTFRLKIS
jgi:Siphovirus Gp157